MKDVHSLRHQRCKHLEAGRTNPQPQFPRCVPAFNVEPKVVMYVRNGPWCRIGRQISKYVSLGNTIHGTRLAPSRGYDDVVQLQLELRPWELCQS